MEPKDFYAAYRQSNSDCNQIDSQELKDNNLKLINLFNSHDWGLWLEWPENHCHLLNGNAVHEYIKEKMNADYVISPPDGDITVYSGGYLIAWLPYYSVEESMDSLINSYED